MQIEIHGHHYEVTDILKEYTHKKLEKLVPYADLISRVQINYRADKLNNIAESHITVIGNPLIASAESSNMNAAMDALIDKILRQIKKHKDKKSHS